MTTTAFDADDNSDDDLLRAFGIVLGPGDRLWNLQVDVALQVLRRLREPTPPKIQIKLKINGDRLPGEVLASVQRAMGSAVADLELRLAAVEAEYGLLSRQTIKPERVLTPEQTRALEELVARHFGVNGTDDRSAE